MFKMINFADIIFCIKTLLVINIVFFVLFMIAAPAKAANIELVGFDVGFDGSFGKPKVMCANPRFTKEEMRVFENM